MRGSVVASPSSRGLAFWLVTILLVLLLPAPVAIAVVVARLRRAPRLAGAPLATAAAGIEVSSEERARLTIFAATGGIDRRALEQAVAADEAAARGAPHS
jgi:hypothetical protein